MEKKSTVNIGKYLNCEKIASGGMGAVYLAKHPDINDMRVVIKKLTLRSGGANVQMRFKREAKILSELSSPYIVRMFDFLTEGRSNYIVLEYVDGMSLDKVLEKQISLPPQLAMLIFLDACLGLKSAHSKNIVHRDIKPGNILISRRAEIKLADFGIASSEKDKTDEKKIGSSDETVADSPLNSQPSITLAGSTLGTPAYMSPEQLEDSSSVDQRADIYSMGVMLYEMVTGTKPFPGDMAPSTLLKIRRGSYIPPEKINRNLPPVVKSLIKKMMKANPQRRPKLENVIQKIKNYLKNYDTHALRIALAKSVISPRTVTYPEFEPKNKNARRVVYICCAAAVLAAAGTFAWKQGVIHRTILKHWWTQISLSMSVPLAAGVNADIPPKAFFFINDNDEIPEIKGARRTFSCDKNSAEKNAKVLEYRAKDVWLKSGNYRIKIVEGPYVWWKSISVDRKKIEGGKLQLEFDFLKNASRNVSFHFSALDAESGKDLTSTSQFRIQVGSKWMDVRSVDFSRLKSGSVYKFLIIHDGYFDEYFSLLVDWYQDEIFINGALRKKE
jgi:serine/threonine-protein kinase